MIANEEYKSVFIKRTVGKTIIDHISSKYPLTKDEDVTVVIPFSEAEVFYSFDDKNPVRLSWDAATELLKRFDNMQNYHGGTMTYITLEYRGSIPDSVRRYHLFYELASGAGGIYQHLVDYYERDGSLDTHFWIDLLKPRVTEYGSTPLSVK